MMFKFLNSVSGKKNKILNNIILAMAGKCISLIGVLVVGIIIARYLGKEQYGLMNYVVSYVAIFQIFADFGLDNIQIREESRTPEKRDEIIGTVFGLKLFFAFITILAIIVTTFAFESNGTTRLYILVYSISILLNTSWVTRHHFTSMVWNEYIVKTEISRTIIGIAIKVLFVTLHLPLIYFIISLVIDSMLLAIGYTTSYCKKIDTIRKWTFNKELAKYLTKQAFPLLLSGTAIIVYNKIDQIMIGNMISNSELGIYSVAVRFAELLVFIPTIISQTISPVLVAAHEENVNKYEHISSLFMNVTVTSCIIIAIITSILSYPIVYYTFGSTYIEASAVLNILAFKIIGDALSQTSGQLIIIEGIQKYSPIRNIIGCCVCILLNLFFIEKFGIKGAAIVSLITILTSGTIANLIIPKYRRIFHKQVHSIFRGWKDIPNIRLLLNE